MKNNYLLLALFFLANPVLAGIQTFTGTARDLNGNFKYTEKYQIELNKKGLADSIKSKYYDENNKLISSIESDYTKHRFIPDSTYIDVRINEKVVTRVQGNKLFLEVTDKDANIKTKTLDITPNMVMGQGFHNYILYHLNNFKTGETRELKFVLESRLDYFNFTFNYLGSDEKNPTLTNYRLDIKSWILKLFADALSVQYDTKKRRLMKLHIS